MQLVIVAGILAGLLTYEFLGLSAGGIIVPGYLALLVAQPLRLAVLLIVAFMVWGLYRLAGRWIILFGRRRLVFMSLASILAGLAVESASAHGLLGPLPWQVFGFIVPGLLANDFERQGVPKTLAAVAIAMAGVYLVMRVTGTFRVY